MEYLRLYEQFMDDINPLEEWENIMGEEENKMTEALIVISTSIFYFNKIKKFFLQLIDKYNVKIIEIGERDKNEDPAIYNKKRIFQKKVYIEVRGMRDDIQHLFWELMSDRPSGFKNKIMNILPGVGLELAIPNNGKLEYFYP